jgi:DNA-directed RNA polymerase specialized sigma24 family protein
MLTTIKQLDFFLEQFSTICETSISEPEYYLMHRDLLSAFYVANEKEQEVIQLKKKGYNMSQIAAELGIHHSTCQERLHRAYHKILSTLLEGHFYDDEEIGAVLDTLTQIENRYKL